MSRLQIIAAIAGVSALGGCANAPSVDSPGAHPTGVAIASPVASEVVLAATSMLGAPYRYGGAGPGGFDCSGLVQFAHWRAGIAVPRTAQAQRAAAVPVAATALQAGDLVFFRDRAGNIFHVGIYVGDGRFVHAPATGRRVGYARLDDEFYRSRFAGAGRFPKSE